MARDRATDIDRLVAAAADVFREKGYRNATIDDIAEAAGISRPTVYKYTKSKQHLLDLMVGVVTTNLENSLREVLDGPGPSERKLYRYVAAHVDAATSHATFYTIVFNEEVELSQAGRDQFRAWAHTVTTGFVGLLEDHLEESGTARDVQIPVVANLVLSMLTSLHRWYDPTGPVSRDDLVAQTVQLIESGLTSPGR